MARENVYHLHGPGDPPENDNPHSLEAEQSLLGCILFDNDALEMISHDLKPDHFREPIHARMFAQISRERAGGYKVDAYTLSHSLRGDASFKELGGLTYLADLVDHAPPVITIDAWAQKIVDASAARALIEMANMIGRFARHGVDDDGVPITSTKIIEIVESKTIEIGHGDPRLVPVSAAEGGAQLMAGLRQKEVRHGVNIGLGSLTAAIGPMLPKELYIVAGRPSMGKSVVGSHMALRAANPGWWVRDEAFGAPAAPLGLSPPVGVLEINGEMSVSQMTARHMADLGHEIFGTKFGAFEGFPSFEDMRNKAVSVAQEALMDEVSATFGQLAIKMLKRSGLRVSQLRSVARRQAMLWAREGIELGLLVVDHVGLLRAEGKASSRYEAQSEIAMAMQELADDLNIPVLALVQLNREVDKRDIKKPQLSDLRDAGAWEECADVVMFPYREQYYAVRSEAPKGGEQSEDWQAWDKARKSKRLEIVMGKNRSGRVKGADLWCEVSHNALRATEPDMPRRNML